MRIEDPSDETALKVVSGILATAYQRYQKVVRFTPEKPDKEVDNATVSRPHVVDGQRTRR